MEDTPNPNPPPDTVEDRHQLLKQRLKAGVIDGVGFLMLYTAKPPNLDEDPWTIVPVSDLAAMPPGVFPNIRLSRDTRLSEIPIKYRNGATIPSRIFARIEKGKSKNVFL